MILIIGSSKDDILYFDTILKNKITCAPQFGKYPTVSGTIFNQNVTICYGLYTSYVTATVLTSLILQYKPIIVIQVGKCKSITKDFNNGDIAISKCFRPIDVDQSEYTNVKSGQIPGYDAEYNVPIDLLNLINASFDKFIINNTKSSVFLCSNKVFHNEEEFAPFMREGFIFGHQSHAVVDSESFGALVPCVLNDIPFFAVKAIDSKVGEVSTIKNFIKTLDTYAKIGKSIVSFIGEIGRHDLKE